MEKGEKYTFWAFPGDVYWYTLNMYWYTLGFGHFWPKCTGTPCSAFPIPTSFRILAITCSLLI